MGFHHVGQTGLKLLISSDPDLKGALASQSAGITGMSHYTQLSLFYKEKMWFREVELLAQGQS